MIFEGTYWLNEAEDNDIFYEYQRLNGDMTKERNIAYFHMPTSFNTPVTAGAGREEALSSGVKTYAFLNNNMTTKRGQEGALAASKAFLKFLYTDEEVKNFIKQSGTTKLGIDVEIDDEVLGGLNKAQKSVMTARANNRVVQQLADNATLRESGRALSYGINFGYRPHIEGVNYRDIVAAIDAGKSARECFEANCISASTWATTYYKGNA